MNEAVEQIAVMKLPLDQLHRSVGAVMIDRDGWSVPDSYGDELFEYAAVRERGAGLFDLSSRGRLLISGSEAVAFLNGLITNDMKTLELNHWMAAVFPNVQGRLIASVRVVRTGAGFIMDTEPATRDAVLQMVQRFTFAGDFRVIDLSSEEIMLSVQGKDAAQIVSTALADASVADISTHEIRQLHWSNSQVTVIRATHTGEDGFDLLVTADRGQELWSGLVHYGARPAGLAALERLRIEAGEPRYGFDMDDTNVVTETNLDDAVSYTKGCYIGQEIIARIKYRGHVAKKLTGLLFDQPVKVEPGTTIKSGDGRDIGRITSVTFSPHLGRTVALGYVKFDFLAADTEIRVNGAAGELHAVVSKLPFISRVNE